MKLIQLAKDMSAKVYMWRHIGYFCTLEDAASARLQWLESRLEPVVAR